MMYGPKTLTITWLNKKILIFSLRKQVFILKYTILSLLMKKVYKIRHSAVLIHRANGLEGSDSVM